MISTINPESMTADERRCEEATILARRELWLWDGGFRCDELGRVLSTAKLRAAQSFF